MTKTLGGTGTGTRGAERHKVLVYVIFLGVSPPWLAGSHLHCACINGLMNVQIR